MKHMALKRITDTLVQLAAVYAGFVLFGFGWDKLTGTNGSVQGFQQIGRGLGVDPTAFRIFVGVQEVAVALALFSAAALFTPAGPRLLSRLRDLARSVFPIATLGLLATMAGALATEFIVRPGEQNWLVVIAIRLSVIGLVALGWNVARFGLPTPARALANRLFPTKVQASGRAAVATIDATSGESVDIAA
ncbi:MAG: hypothetical protein AAFP04_06160 [Myxococcota bacterium]